jgi:hypothetical protein
MLRYNTPKTEIELNLNYDTATIPRYRFSE